MKDSVGNPVAATNPKAVAAFEEAVRGILTHARTTLDDLDRALALDPEFALAHATRGLLLLTLARRELDAAARASHAAAVAALSSGGGGERDSAYVAALGAWLDGEPDIAAAHLDAALQRLPQDSLALKLVHSIRFMTGDQRGMRNSIRTVIDRVATDHPHRGYILGCHAFALEEAGEYEVAERTGRRGLELASDDAWGVHAVAHVCEMTHRPGDGIEWVSGHHDGWAACNNFRHHLFWHLALFHLDRKDFDRVLDLYDRRVHDGQSDDFRDIANSASLLARLELEGHGCDRRWAELADLAERRLDDGALPFADLHYLIALEGAGRDDKAIRIARRMDGGRVGPAPRDQAADHTATGLRAYMLGDYAAACEELSSALPVMVRLGGSHAQRDVFVRFAIEAAIRAGRFGEARTLIETRLGRRTGIDTFSRDRLDRIDRGLAQIGAAAAIAEPTLLASAWY